MTMLENSKDYIAGVYRIERPDMDALPLIFDSPHSGRDYPEDFGHSCPTDLLHRAEDNYVDDLFDCVPMAGGTLLSALFPRTYIDVNRAMTDIDAEMLEEPWPDVLHPTQRSQSGSGLLRKTVHQGAVVYDRKLSTKEAQQRIEKYYIPYHAALTGLIDEAHLRAGASWHIDCHSMPVSTPDFCIGDRHGTSCAREFTEMVYDFLKRLGYRVDINHPYKGAEILRRHGRPEQGRHSLQLEINKSLYWDMAEGRKSTGYNDLKDSLQRLVLFCASWVEAQIDGKTGP